jgi:hypothetical protein
MVFNAIFSDISVIILLGEYIFCNLINRRNRYYVAINQVTVPGTVRIIKHKHAIKLFLSNSRLGWLNELGSWIT